LLNKTTLSRPFVVEDVQALLAIFCHSRRESAFCLRRHTLYL
jgi:hypothetical protein